MATAGNGMRVFGDQLGEKKGDSVVRLNRHDDWYDGCSWGVGRQYAARITHQRVVRHGEAGRVKNFRSIAMVLLLGGVTYACGAGDETQLQGWTIEPTQDGYVVLSPDGEMTDATDVTVEGEITDEEWTEFSTSGEQAPDEILDKNVKKKDVVKCDVCLCGPGGCVCTGCTIVRKPTPRPKPQPPIMSIQ